MWNLLGYREQGNTLTEVTIIGHYFNTDKKLTYLIAVDSAGTFYNEFIGHFRSQNKKGFILESPLV